MTPQAVSANRDAMSMGWDDIERHPGFAGARARAAREIPPLLGEVKPEKARPNRQKDIIQGFLVVPFGLFVVTFITLDFTLPQTPLWIFVRFLLFPVLFLTYMAIALFLMRGKILQLLTEAQARLRQKSAAMRTIAVPLGLDYVPAPGGAPKGLEWLAKQSWAPAALREAATTLNEAGGMDDAVAAVREAGLLIESNVYVVGTPEQKARYYDQAAGIRQMEDGFQGVRAGLRLSMFEWVEKVDEAPDVIHLMIVLDAPLRLQGLTQLRARKTGWPQDPKGRTLQDVDLGPKAFDALYRLRATDQVEARAIFNPAVIERVIALAHGGRFRAVAQYQSLVFDFAGAANRFQLIDLLTGAWSEETIQQTHADLAEALALVDTLAHAFMVAKKSDTGGA
jgi:hypothetical protein